MGSKGSNTTTQTSTYAPNADAMAAYQSILQRAQGVANTPYTPYGGELVAGINPQQTMGIGNVNANANWAQPYIQGAIGQAQTSSAPLSAASIQSYMNPYTQNVVDATRAQFSNQNAQDLQRIRGNAIAQGALGGNRQAIAEAELAGQQQRAQAPVIAGLYNQGYNQAVNTAAGQQALGLQGAGMIGNLGVAGQGTGLQGAQAQLGAGTLQQNTQQMLDTARLQQYQQAQAFPYQQAQWLAGIASGIGSQMGGTNSGQTTAPAPSPWNAIGGLLGAGVGMAGQMGLFSDERVKENIHEVGRLHDGQKIYRYNYKGDPRTQVGLIAQEVEHHKPEAVSKANGVRLVDYDTATEDAVKERAYGGGVGLATGGVPGMPWGGSPSFIPEVNLPRGGGPRPAAAPPAPSQPQNDLSKQAASVGDLAKTLRNAMGSDNIPSDISAGMGIPGAVGPTSVGGSAGPMPLTDAYAGTASNPLPGLDASDYEVGGWARGGVVSGYADGGSPSFDDRFNAVYGQDVVNPDSPFRMPDKASLGEDSPAVSEWRQTADRDIGRIPNEAPEQAIEAKGVAPERSAPQRTLAFAGTPNTDDNLPSEITRGYTASKKSSGVATPEQTQPSPTSSDSAFGADSKLWPALISAGFGMMASRSPFFGQAIGEGGQAGIASYNLQQQREFEARKFAEQHRLAREKFEAEKEQAERPYEEMTADQKSRMALQKAQWQRLNMEPVDIGYDALGRAIKALRQPDGSFRVLDPQTGRALAPGETLGGGGVQPNSLITPPGGAPAAKPFTVSETVPTVLQDPKLPGYMKVANETPQRDEAVIQQLENMPGGKLMATTVRGLVSYDIDPAKLSNNKGGRDMAIAYAKMYDPSFDQTLYNAKQASVKEFFAGGPQSPAGVMTAGNTAILHLSEMYDLANNMEKNAGTGGYTEAAANWVGKQGIPFISKAANQIRNKGAEGTGSEFSKNLADWQVAKTRFADEVTKFYAGSGGSEGERERALAVLNEAKSWPELKSAIKQDLILMRDKVEQMQGRLTQGLNPGIWRDVAKRDPSLILLYKNSREASDKILSGSHTTPPPAAGAPQPSATAKPSLEDFLAKAKQANPNASTETLTEYYNKKYGGQ